MSASASLSLCTRVASSTFSTEQSEKKQKHTHTHKRHSFHAHTDKQKHDTHDGVSSFSYFSPTPIVDKTRFYLIFPNCTFPFLSFLVFVCFPCGVVASRSDAAVPHSHFFHLVAGLSLPPTHPPSLPPPLSLFVSSLVKLPNRETNSLCHEDHHHHRLDLLLQLPLTLSPSLFFVFLRFDHSSFPLTGIAGQMQKGECLLQREQNLQKD